PLAAAVHGPGRTVLAKMDAVINDLNALGVHSLGFNDHLLDGLGDDDDLADPTVKQLIGPDMPGVAPETHVAAVGHDDGNPRQVPPKGPPHIRTEMIGKQDLDAVFPEKIEEFNALYKACDAVDAYHLENIQAAAGGFDHRTRGLA